MHYADQAAYGQCSGKDTKSSSHTHDYSLECRRILYQLSYLGDDLSHLGDHIRDNRSQCTTKCKAHTVSGLCPCILHGSSILSSICQCSLIILEDLGPLLNIEVTALYIGSQLLSSLGSKDLFYSQAGITNLSL